MAIDYFTIPARSVTQITIIKFIDQHIIHQFGLPETITTYQGSVFRRVETTTFAKIRGVKSLTSTPYYAQAIGQAESSNKVVKGILEKMIKENPKSWHTLLSEAL